MNIIKTSLFAMTLSLIGCGPAPDMPTYTYDSTSLAVFDTRDEKAFYLLPLKGQVIDGERLWSGYHWPFNKGSIDVRWNATNHTASDYTPNRDALIFMVPESIEELSPAEKFDILLGRYDYPIKKRVNLLNNPYAQNWEGVVNGWAMAASQHNEPKAKTLFNPDGIPVRFSSSDIKALLSFYYDQEFSLEGAQQMGRNCPSDTWYNFGNKCASDLNAGNFHVILANKLGNRNESFLMDFELDKEVVSYPVFSFNTKVESERSADEESVAGTVKVITIKTVISYIERLESPKMDSVRGTIDQQVRVKELNYDLYLNFKNEIIGGTWLMEDRPDFLWMINKNKDFKGLYKGLGHLLND